MLSDHAATIDRAYCGGAPVQDMVVAARGEQGRVWRLVTDEGTFAVKDLFITSSEQRTDAKRLADH
jgi:hypothetical protein